MHIVPHEQGWALKREGSSQVESVHATQKDAIDAGRDLSRQDEVDLVVHRQDGTFRNVLTYTNEPMNGKNNGDKVQPHDLFSVGSRVSWPAIVAGATVALAMSAVLWLGGVALGITVSDQVSGQALTLGAALWMLASALASLFVGGYVVCRLTTGEKKKQAVMYGVILWGFMFAASMILAGAGLNTGMQVASLRPASSTETTFNREAYREANLTDTQIAAMERKMQEAREGASELSPTAAAWWAFTSLILSMGAAIGGAWLGAGPNFFFVERSQRGGVATMQPST
jgi:hypothetical protein